MDAGRAGLVRIRCPPFRPTPLTARSVVYLLLLVARSKLVPDFACTIAFLHLVASSLYERAVPASLAWWALQAASTALMASLGVWACRYRELRPISFGGRAAETQSARQGAGGEAGAAADEEQGFGRGRGRGRGRDAAGEYEMVGMGDSTENG